MKPTLSLSLLSAAALAAVGLVSLAQAAVVPTGYTVNDCGPNRTLCRKGFSPVCTTRGVWLCRRDLGLISSSSSSNTCVAMCPDGYKYPTCAADGSPINYFADPCMNHYSSSSVDASCGPNYLMCRVNTVAKCVSGQWTCQSTRFSSSSSVSRCGINTIRCINGTRPACMPNGQWQCVANEEIENPAGSCLATCPDGFQYYTCAGDGHRFRFLTNPCNGHFPGESSSSVSSSACREDSLTCSRDKYKVCVDGLWQCVEKNPSTSPTGPVIINFISPASGGQGNIVTLEGKGFAGIGNSVFFGDVLISNVKSADGTKLQFTVPQRPAHRCSDVGRSECATPISWFGNAVFEVKVIVGADTSNIMTFTMR